MRQILTEFLGWLIKEGFVSFRQQWWAEAAAAQFLKERSSKEDVGGCFESCNQEVHDLLDRLFAVCDEAGYAMIAAVELKKGFLKHKHTHLKRGPADLLEDVVTEKLKNRHL